VDGRTALVAAAAGMIATWDMVMFLKPRQLAMLCQLP
jgi:hypothetical protein